MYWRKFRFFLMHVLIKNSTESTLISSHSSYGRKLTQFSASWPQLTIIRHISHLYLQFNI